MSKQKPGTGVAGGEAVLNLDLILNNHFDKDRAAGESANSYVYVDSNGIGQILVFETNGAISMSNGEMVMSKTAAAWGETWTYSPWRLRNVGLFHYAKLSTATPTSIYFMVGFSRAEPFHSYIEGAYFQAHAGTFLSAMNANSDVSPNITIDDGMDFSEVNEVIAICFLTGTYTVVRYAGEQTWRLLFFTVTNEFYPLLPVLLTYSAISVTVEKQVIGVLGGPWATNFSGISEHFQIGVSLSDTFTHSADCLIGIRVGVLPSAGYIQVFFRGMDGSNFWNIGIHYTGDIYLWEIVDDAWFERATTTGTPVADNSYVLIRLVGNRIIIWVDNTDQIDYASANNFQTGTNGGVRNLGTGGTLLALIADPYWLSGDTADEIDKYVSV